MSEVRRHRSTSAEALEETAAVIDLVCAASQATPEAEQNIRRELFLLLDNPTPENWFRVRELQVLPQYLPGLTTPSPMGLTVGNIVYLAGLSDRVCPSRGALLRALKLAVSAHMAQSRLT